MPGTASVGQEVRARGLNGAESGGGDAANRLEILIRFPARRKGREGEARKGSRSHCVSRCCGRAQAVFEVIEKFWRGRKKSSNSTGDVGRAARRAPEDRMKYLRARAT